MTQAFITKNAKLQSENLIAGIQDTTLRKRLFVYSNAIESLSEYFQAEGFSSSTKTSLFKNLVIASKFDIADFYIDKLRADVRIFDDSSLGVFIPKQHKELGIEPDIYIAIKIDENLQSYEIAGFIPSEQLIFDKSVQDYYILSAKKLLPIDRLKKLSPNLKTKKYKTNLDEQSVLSLFTKIQEGDLPLNAQKALLYCLLANSSISKKLNTLLKVDSLSNNINNFPELLDSVKPGAEQELINEAIDVEEIQQDDELSEVIQDEEIDSLLKDLSHNTTIETKISDEKEIELEGAQSDYIKDEEIKRSNSQSPLFLHVLSIILIGAVLTYWGISQLNQQEPATPQKAPQNTINNAIIPVNEARITKLSWGLEANIAKDSDLKDYFKKVGSEIKDYLSEEITSISNPPTNKQMKVIIILDNRGSYKTSIVKISSGSNEFDNLVLEEIKNTFQDIAPKNITAFAPFIRAILIINF